MAGTFAPSPSVRGLLWGLDGIALIVATAMLTVHLAVQLFMGHALTPLSQPLPFFAYPFLVATLFGWAWVHYRDAA
jgi:hypothetical protein